MRKEIATALRRVRRRQVAEDTGGRGFTKRMRLVTTSIFIQSESRDCAKGYLVQALRRKLPAAQRLVEDWVLQTPDDTMLSVSVTPNLRNSLAHPVGSMFVDCGVESSAMDTRTNVCRDASKRHRFDPQIHESAPGLVATGQLP